MFITIHRDNPATAILEGLCTKFSVTVDKGQIEHFLWLVGLNLPMTTFDMFYKVLTDDERENVDDYWVS